ncbi:flagellar basal body P-ring formation chaperone FlgA [Chitinivorax sp. B]|uniref:flagellar basal body P-ring formation chaperone FlgA n=1 Tax=Chitinivorax sp. B TaxID=2502235 RepID=UPI0010FA3004|nr:flagellar basal body P-ring formation chaperone FlgA [Chitinivorax sp. B]
MIRIPSLLCYASLVLAYSTSQATNRQDLNQLVRTAEQFARSQLTGTDVTVTARKLDANLSLPACDKLEPFSIPNTKLVGRTVVGIRCPNAGWSINVTLDIEQFGDAVVTKHPLRAGQLIRADDLQLQRMEVGRLPAPPLNMLDQAIGRIPIAGIGSGVPIRAEMLRAPAAVLPGQSVRILVNGDGFQVSGEGKALGQAAIGQSISIRTSNGQVVTGVVTDTGVVSVIP